MDEGYIKFKCNWVKDKPVAKEDIQDINSWRNRLYKMGLIGVYVNGIGFGNISTRLGITRFLISGSATGSIPQLNENHYTIVNEYDLEQNSLICTGPVRASSESLSHAVIYDSLPSTNAVIHIHHLKLWKELLHALPTTRLSAAYGTPEMAMEIKRLLAETDIKEQKTIIMGGHEEGILVFGESLNEAGDIVLKLFEKFKT